jgi:hypothetical protein
MYTHPWLGIKTKHKPTSATHIPVQKNIHMLRPTEDKLSLKILGMYSEYSTGACLIDGLNR